MRKFNMMLCLLALVGCAKEPTEPDDGIPDSCYNHTAKEFHFGDAPCKPLKSPECGFNAQNLPTQLDGTGEPLAYYCTCTDASYYACFGSPSFVKADPLP
jgi:hypothetical protein